MRATSGARSSSTAWSVRARSFGTITTRRFDASVARLPAASRPARSTRSICASSALQKTSAGAPSRIWRAWLLDAPTFTSTRVPVARSKSAAAACRTLVRLEAAKTTTAGGAPAPGAGPAAASASQTAIAFMAVNLV